jgi:uncharacterized protein YceH (UPF0502 family)
MSYGRTPSWVYEQRQAISDASHASTAHRLQDRIEELEKENADLKNRIEKLEDVLLIAMQLALKT